MSSKAMKSLCLVLLLAVSVPGCSRFSKSQRVERAYYKHLAKASAARQKSQKMLIQRQRAEIKSLRNSPPPLGPQTVQSSVSENQ
jgi:hypothetical protein